MTRFRKTMTYNQNYALCFGYISSLSNCSGYSGSTPKKNQYLDIRKREKQKAFCLIVSCLTVFSLIAYFLAAFLYFLSYCFLRYSFAP